MRRGWTRGLFLKHTVGRGIAVAWSSPKYKGAGIKPGHHQELPALVRLVGGSA